MGPPDVGEKQCTEKERKKYVLTMANYAFKRHHGWVGWHTQAQVYIQAYAFFNSYNLYNIEFTHMCMLYLCGGVSGVLAETSHVALQANY